MTRAELLINAKPILFQTDMVRAILDGRKTQTRRVVKPQPRCKNTKFEKDRGRLVEYSMICSCWNEIKIHKPRYQTGDILYVRETWTDSCKMLQNALNGNSIHYCADYKNDTTGLFSPCKYKKKPSIHMSKEAARIFLRVTGVRAERLRDISVQDCCREGIAEYWVSGNSYADIAFTERCIDEFKKLWDSINAKPKPVYTKINDKKVISHYVSYPWEDVRETREYRGKEWKVFGNPQVFVYDFEGINCE